MKDKSPLLNELQLLVNECIKSNLNRPETKFMRSIAELVNKESSLIPQLAEILRLKLIETKLPVSQYLLLDLIEYTTCRCGPALHKEYNAKSFLKAINTVLKNQELTNDVKEKALYLIQFWVRYFKDDTVTYKNFPWYFNNIKNMNIPFPADVESPYERMKPADMFKNNHIRESQVDISEFNKKQLKLYKDLNIVLDSIEVANTMIDENEFIGLTDVILHIEGMETKLKNLPARLKKANEDFLHRYTIAILKDIEATKKRHKLLKNNKSTPQFKSKTRDVVIGYKREESKNFNDYKLKLESEYTIPEEKPQMRSESEILVHRTNENHNKGFDQIGNYFYKDESSKDDKDLESDFLGFDMSNNTGNTSNVKNPIDKQPRLAPKDIDLLDLNTINPEQQKEVQNMIKFGIQNDQNRIDLDFTEELEKKDHNKVNATEHKKLYVPNDEIKFEKPGDQVKGTKVEYDPFSDIGDFDLLK